MGDKTGISWTDATWNPIAGCSLVSPGCTNCYAMKEAHRLGGALGQAKYAGLTRKVNGKAVWTGDVRVWPAALEQPLRWRAPRKIFVNSMSDLFHEALDDDAVFDVFAVMALADQHTFQVLTKRPERMRAMLTDTLFWPMVEGHAQALYAKMHTDEDHLDIAMSLAVHGPLPNVWLGVSAEDQQRADERIPTLLRTPAAVRFVSYEPALGPIDFTSIRFGANELWNAFDAFGEGLDPGEDGTLDWVIFGGESGDGARPCDIAWARSTVEQCDAAGVACFVKQMGSRPMLHGAKLPERFKSSGGKDVAEFPLDLQVQEFPR